MCNTIEKNKITANLDQGIHNYMLYFNKLCCNVKILTNKDNFVNTVGCDFQNINDDNLIVNSNNEVSYVVHQYDRMTKTQKQKIGNQFKNRYDFTV
jgi:hypothetical protein